MYGYGNSANIWGIVVGVIIGMVILFFVCRELMCWYYKINKIVALLEEQLHLLKRQIPFVATHTVKLLPNQNGLALLAEPSSMSELFEQLSNGTKVQLLYENPKEEEAFGVKGTWYKIITQGNHEGWCFSGSLEKI